MQSKKKFKISPNINFFYRGFPPFGMSMMMNLERLHSDIRKLYKCMGFKDINDPVDILQFDMFARMPAKENLLSEMYAKEV